MQHYLRGYIVNLPQPMETAFDQFWCLISGALWLNPEAYQQINTLPLGTQLSLLIVLIVGLAQAIGQCIVLFINRVKPFRFILSLGIAAILFAFAYGFWALSIWFVSSLLLETDLNLLSVVRTLGLSYTPLMFSFLIALPYFGVPISVLLLLWSLLAEITGLRVLTELNDWGAFACAGLGWVVLQALQRTVGRPVTAFARWLSNTVAGTKLVRDREGLQEIVQFANPPTVALLSNEILIENTTPRTQVRKRFSTAKLIVLGLIAVAVVVFLSSPSQDRIFTWYGALNATIKLIFDLIGISLIALFCSILLTPLEALSWWAGWYGEEALENIGTPVREVYDPSLVARYVMYLDGINQGSEQHLPQVDNFLNHLAHALPPNVLIVKGILPYSVTNRALTEDRPLAFLWRIVESLALKNPANPIGFIINLRNIVAVAVAADPRYGSIQNQGLAQVLFNSLISFGYPLGCQIPVTLIGYSGGGQMSMGAVPYLKQALNAPVDVISLAGVISGNTGAMAVQQLYHLVGEKDIVERVGPIMFPGRWPLLFLSNWNCGKRRGKIALISLGPVGHNGPNGPMSAEAVLPDGRTNLQQTVDIMTGILRQDWVRTGLKKEDFISLSNYERYQSGLFNQVSYYPLNQSINLNHYQPIGTWMGRLILPRLEDRQQVKGVLFEIHHADADNQHRIGQIVNLRWSHVEAVQNYVQLVTKDLHFIDQAYLSQRQGNIHPERINHWQKVDPLESLAGARPIDDVIVKLPEPVVISDTGAGRPTIYINREPIQITGRFYGVVKILQFVGGDLFRVCHYNPHSQQFNGSEEIVYIPSVIADQNGVLPSSNHELEKSPVNAKGWLIYGAKNRDGKFVVQALAPRCLFKLHPDRIIQGQKTTINFINFHCWDNTVDNKGHAYTVLLNPSEIDDNQQKISPQKHNSAAEKEEVEPLYISQYWKEGVSEAFPEGTRALLMHVYGGIGGEKSEFAPLGMFFGHLAYGLAEVVRDALTNELRFEIEYRQVYTQNTDGIISGTLSWMRYMGDRQYGWLGSRPTCDLLIKFSPLTEDYNFNGIRFSPLTYVINELDVMAARYRLGDGTGTTFVTPINSCVQDSSQALYKALNRMIAEFNLNPLIMKWLREHPQHEQTQRFILLGDLVKSLEHYLKPFKKTRQDWQYNEPTLGSFAVETPGETLLRTLASWRTLLPRWTADQIAMIFLKLGASLWLLRTNQVGGNDSDIAPIAPTDFGTAVPQIKRVKRLK